MTGVAFLRGINVGGNNIVDMKRLKATFESLGLGGVSTYINSGNVVFEAVPEDPRVLVADMERAIRQDFGLDIPVIVRSVEHLERICREVPATWVNNEAMRTDVMFLWEQFDTPAVMELLRVNPVDEVRYVPGAIVWHVDDRSAVRKSGMVKLMGTELYRNMTIRNINTVRKLYEIAK